MFLLINTVSAIDGVDFLTNHCFQTISITTTNISLKFKTNSGYNSVNNNDIRRKFGENNIIHTYTPVSRGISEYIANDETLVITPDQTTSIEGRHLMLMFKPVIFKNNIKGFRIVQWQFGGGIVNTNNIIKHVVLSDTPIIFGEEDEEMIMDDGKWVNVKDSKSLEIDKLGFSTYSQIKLFEQALSNTNIMQNRILAYPKLAETFTNYIEKGWLVVEHDSPNEIVNPTKSNWIWWLFASSSVVVFIIFHCLRK